MRGPTLAFRPQMRNTGAMVSYRLVDAAAVLGISDDTLRRWADAGRVPTHRGNDGRVEIEGRDLAELAKDLLTHGHPGVRDADRSRAVSARNRMRGLVTAVVKDRVMAQVEMVCGPYRIVSLMSTEAAEELGLEPGVIAVASVKSTAVVVERA